MCQRREPILRQRRQSKYFFFGGGRSRRRRRRGGWGPLGEGPGEEHGPLPRILFDFGCQNGDLWCILGAIFCSSAKTLRGRKDTLAQVYLYWGEAIALLAPPRIDATVSRHKAPLQHVSPYISQLVNCCTTTAASCMYDKSTTNRSNGVRGLLMTDM